MRTAFSTSTLDTSFSLCVRWMKGMRLGLASNTRRASVFAFLATIEEMKPMPPPISRILSPGSTMRESSEASLDSYFPDIRDCTSVGESMVSSTGILYAVVCYGFQ